MFSKMKRKLILKLSEAKTYEEYKNIRDVFDYCFVWMVIDIEELERKVTQKKFNTIEEATNSIASLKEDIMKKMNKLESEASD